MSPPFSASPGPSQLLGHHRIGLSSLRYAAISCWLSILHMGVAYMSMLLSQFIPPPPPLFKGLNLFSLPSFQPPVVKTKARLDVIKNKGLGYTSSLFVSRLFVFSFYQYIQAFSFCMMSSGSFKLIFQALSRQPQMCWHRRINTAHLPAETLGTLVWTSPVALPPTLGWQFLSQGYISCLDGITDSTDMSLSKLWEAVKDRTGSLRCCSPRGCKEWNMT